MFEMRVSAAHLESGVYWQSFAEFVCCFAAIQPQISVSILTWHSPLHVSPSTSPSSVHDYLSTSSPLTFFLKKVNLYSFICKQPSSNNRSQSENNSKWVLFLWPWVKDVYFSQHRHKERRFGQAWKITFALLNQRLSLRREDLRNQRVNRDYCCITWPGA